MGSQQKRHLQTLFPTYSFPGLSSQSTLTKQRTAARCAAHTGAGSLPEGTCSFPFRYVTCTSSFCSSAVRCMAKNRGKAHLKVCGVPLIPSLWAFKGKRRILTRMDQQMEIHFSLWYQGLPPFLAAPSCPPAACARSAVGQCEQGQG